MILSYGKYPELRMFQLAHDVNTERNVLDLKNRKENKA